MLQTEMNRNKVSAFITNIEFMRIERNRMIIDADCSPVTSLAMKYQTTVPGGEWQKSESEV